MTPLLLAYAIAVAVLSWFGGRGYCSIWRDKRTGGATPTGFGGLIAPAMLGAGLIVPLPGELTAALHVATLVAIVFWVDDLVQLSAKLRLVTSFVAGAAIGFGYLAGLPWFLLVPALLVAGAVCVALTNMVNFCDGADLNLATFIMLTLAMILVFTPADRGWVPVAIAALAFIVPFAAINRRPRTLYLGDSGSAAFAGLLTAMAVAFAADVRAIAPEAAIPAALPTLDVAYVFAVRIIEKHDLLTRNYLHLYQRLQRRYPGFGYLLPQLANVALCLAAATAMQGLGLGRIAAVVAAMLLVTPPFYFLCRRRYLAGPPEGPLYETTR